MHHSLALPSFRGLELIIFHFYVNKKNLCTEYVYFYPHTNSQTNATKKLLFHWPLSTLSPKTKRSTQPSHVTLCSSLTKKINKDNNNNNREKKKEYSPIRHILTEHCSILGGWYIWMKTTSSRKRRPFENESFV